MTIKLKHLIERIFTKKNIKIFLLMFVVLGFFVGTSFAQSNQTQHMTLVQELGYVFRILISILSWVWIVLATLAGKLMTNEFVYGTFLHLDKALWDLWNIMKNFANFALGFILIFTIVKNLFKGSLGTSKDDPVKAAKDTIIHTLIAGVLVQMSRFLMAVLLDFSTIATAAVGSLPSQFMANSTSFQTNVERLISTGTTKRLVVDFSADGNIVQTTNTTGVNSDDDVQKILDTIMPTSNSMVGPLIFLGASVFNLYDLSDTSVNVNGTDDIGDLVLSLGIQGFVLLAFSLMLAFMFLFNLFRVITLRVIIPLMPFIVLATVFFKGKSDKIKGFLGEVLNYENIIKLVFKPVYMTLVLSIILIVMVLVRALAKANGGFIDMTQQNNITVGSTQEDNGFNKSSLDVGGIAEIKLNMKETIVDLMVYIFGLILMYMLMKSCVLSGTGIGFIDNTISKLSNSLWGEKGKLGGILGSVGVVPIGGKKVGLSSLTTMTDKIVNNDRNAWARKLGIDVDKENEAISKRLGQSSFSSLNTSMSKKDWVNKAVSIGKDKYNDVGRMLSDGSFSTKLDERNKVHPTDVITNGNITTVWDGGSLDDTQQTEKGPDEGEKKPDASGEQPTS